MASFFGALSAIICVFRGLGLGLCYVCLSIIISTSPIFLIVTARAAAYLLYARIVRVPECNYQSYELGFIT